LPCRCWLCLAAVPHTTPPQVTENGVPVPNESEKPLQEALRDVFRLDYYRGYIEGVCQAVAEDGVNLTGYYAWSLMDNFEWLDGYRPRFGVTYVSVGSYSRHCTVQYNTVLEQY
jgi:beta-glucosidase